MELGKPLTHLLYKLHRNFASSLTSPDVYLLEFTKASLDPPQGGRELPVVSQITLHLSELSFTHRFWPVYRFHARLRVKTLHGSFFHRCVCSPWVDECMGEGRDTKNEAT